MSNTWFISDTHFGHANMLKFKTAEGLPLRDFRDVEDMDNTMCENWNRLVKPEDKVYHLGDVAISKKSLKTLSRLNGRKTLIAGNHDIYYSKEYLKYFDNIRACKMYPKHGLIFSHFPVHPHQLEHRFKFNVHGHLHSNEVLMSHGKFTDERYLNICVEKTNYTPISFEEILQKLKIPKEGF